MPEDEKQPLTEPNAVPDQYCDEVRVDIDGGSVRLTGSVILKDAADDGAEHRIVWRVIMLTETARALARDLRNKLAAGGH